MNYKKIFYIFVLDRTERTRERRGERERETERGRERLREGESD